MRKNRFIVFTLWLAFTIVLGHDIVPHHHHDSPEELALADDTHHEGDDLIADFFGHFTHIPNAPSITLHTGGSDYSLNISGPQISKDAVSFPAEYQPPPIPLAETVYHSGSVPLSSALFSDPRSPRAPPLC